MCRREVAGMREDRQARCRGAEKVGKESARHAESEARALRVRAFRRQR